MTFRAQVLEAQNAGRNSVHRLAEAGKSSVHDDEISVGYDGAGLILTRRRKALDEIKQTLTGQREVKGILDVARRLESLGCDRPVSASARGRFHRSAFRSSRFTSDLSISIP
jgi:hypothetical protein